MLERVWRKGQDCQDRLDPGVGTRPHWTRLSWEVAVRTWRADSSTDPWGQVPELPAPAISFYPPVRCNLNRQLQTHVETRLMIFKSFLSLFLNNSSWNCLLFENCCVAMLRHVWFFATLWTVACQVPRLWDSPGKNTGVGCYFLLQGTFLTQVLNLPISKALPSPLHTSHRPPNLSSLFKEDSTDHPNPRYFLPGPFTCSCVYFFVPLVIFF